MAAKYPEGEILQTHEIVVLEVDEKEIHEIQDIVFNIITAEIHIREEFNSQNKLIQTMQQNLVNSNSDKIIHRILDYIPVQALFQLRNISKFWNTTILSYSRFVSKTHVFVSNMRRKSHYKPLREFDSSWKRVRIHKCHNLLTMPANFTDRLLKIEIVLCPMEWKDLIIFLSYTPNLEELVFRKSLVFRPTRVEETPNYRSYEELSQVSHFPNLKSIEVRVKNPHDAFFILNLVSNHSNRLSNVCYGCKSPTINEYEYTEEMTEVILGIIRKHWKTLEHLQSYLWDPIQTRRPQPLTLLEHFCCFTLEKILLILNYFKLNLNSFCIYGGTVRRCPEKCILLINEFIGRQKSIEKIILPKINYPNEVDFYNMIDSLPKTLKSLRVPSKYPLPESIFFGFPKLNEFYAETYECSDVNILIPSNATLPGVHVLFLWLNNFSPLWICQSIRMKRITHAFPLLTELLVRDNGKLRSIHIQDSDFQEICRSYPFLKKLHLSNCDCLTDFGLTGLLDEETKRLLECLKLENNGNDPNIDDIVISDLSDDSSIYPDPGTKVGYAIGSLESMQCLCLQDLGHNITDVSFYFGIKCPSLRVIMLEGHPKVTVYGVHKIFFNNPNLKHWTFKLNSMIIREYIDERERSERNHFHRTHSHNRSHSRDNEDNEIQGGQAESRFNLHDADDTDSDNEDSDD